ncbi:MAG: sigma-70 family RNA polymerase sigma factor [Polyangiaceae bacterium]
MAEHDLAAVITLELLFRTEMEFVMNTARRCGLADADAEDVTQQVFIALQERLHCLHSPESIRPWLVIVTRRLARALTAALGRGLGQEGEDWMAPDFGEIEDDEPLPEERMLRSERRRELLDLIETILPERRIVLVMHVLDELPMPEVAHTLRIPVPTAYNRLRLARRDLKDAASRKGLREDFNLLHRAWDAVVTVRDPWEPYYGRAAITEAVRDRIWGKVVAGVRGAHGSVEAAEREGLRVASPLFVRGAPPRPYAKPRRPRNLLRSERLPIRRHPPCAARPATGSRTP